ncbi:MAG: hypothetical protein ABJA66_03555 [Actinomycetota bacterium]
MPEFEEIAEKIRQEIPNVIVTVSSDTIGSQTQFQGYDFWIECLFTSDYEETDNVALTVGLGHLTTTPRIEAGVIWGYPSGKGEEASFRNWGGIFPNEGIIVSDEVLEDLYRDLPRLYEALFEALKRRKPIDE